MLGSEASGKKPIKGVEKLHPQKTKSERVSHYITKDKKAGAVLTGVGVVVEQARRKTGIDILGGVAWGTHFCVFYQSKQDLIDILVPYFKEGLENNEFCMWITSEPLNAKEAKKSLKRAVNNIDSYIKKGQIEILDYGEWYTKSGKFEADRVLQGWIQKYDDAITRGFDGLRLTGNTFWLEKKGWSEFTDYEESVNNIIGKYKMLAICTYSLDKCGAGEVIDVVNNHQFAIVKREGIWKILESAERKKAEKALQETHDYLDKLINHTNAPIIVWNPAFKINRFNHAFERLTGYTANEVIGQKLSTLFPESSRDESLTKIKRTLRGEYWESVEIPILCKNGQICLALWNSANIYAEDNTTVVATIAQGQDITERKKSEEMLLSERNKLISVFKAIKDGVYIVNQQYDIQYVNPVIEEYFGAWHDQKCYQYFNDREKTCPWCHNEEVFAGKSVRWEWYSFKNQKTYDLIETPLKNPDGSISKLKIFRDITERKKAQKEAHDAQRKLIEQHRHERERAEAELAKVRDELIRTTRLATIGQVSASIAHDLRNPLGAMRNASYFLRRHLSKDELKAPEHLDIIEQEVVKADQIITNLLEMARPKTPHKQEIDLGEIVKDVFSRAKRAEGVRCQTSLVPDPFVVRADPSQLRQMIGNIVDNAVDAMKGQGEIFVEATHDSDYDTLVFRDTGPGFAQEVRERLFEPLVTTKASGTGLGLMICHQIVEKHGGTIGAENCEGRGAAIRVRLPR